MTEPAPSALGAAPRALAWLVHAFTAGGAVLALLALTAIERGDFRLALLWLLAALAVDGVDGSLARLARVRERAPRIDGDTLDLVVDYLTYVFVPALLIVRAGLVPAPLALPLAALILVSSLYCFARTDLKTDDQYFRGFPALWNLVAFYLLVARPGPEAGAAAVVLFAALTFAPVHFVHPFRVTDYGRWLPAVALVWAAATAALPWPGWSEGARAAWLAASLTAAAALVAMGLVRTVRGRR
ncbi:MAG TPA: CDP-alcohol phosphatidyltransferase family protein [Allosphingosinicella sp.]|nr:CDP-alcohol phosphatidyltransferase family protein [Allosphingosinicella sp.]